MGTDVDGDALSYAMVAGPNNGVLTGDGASRAYQPNSGFIGTDSVTYTVSDGSYVSEIATVTFQVVPNGAPLADGQTVVVDEDGVSLITLTGSDPDGDSLSYILVDLPSSGALAGEAPNLSYTPVANFHGSDSFSFRVNDGTAESAIALVSIQVTSVNDAPVSYSQSVHTDEDAPVQIMFEGSDLEGDALTYVIVSGPAHGSLSGSGATRTYTPHENFNGQDSFMFLVNDGVDNSNVSTVTISVAPQNDAPIANSQSLTLNQDAAIGVILTGSDVDGDSLTFTVITGPANGTLTGLGPNLTYIPNSGYFGPDSLVFEVNDGAGGVSQASVSITVVEAPSEVVLFQDSFETGTNNKDWAGKWVEDSQRDFFRSTQRATDGNRSAEVDGLAINATLSMASSVNVAPYASAILTFSWLIESGFDSGEYLTLDISSNGGSSWQNDVRRLNGNLSAENVWHHETVDLAPYTSANLRIRFRSLVSGSSEDANIDNVRITASGVSSGDLAAATEGESEPLNSTSEEKVLTPRSAWVAQLDRVRRLLFANLESKNHTSTPFDDDDSSIKSTAVDAVFMDSGLEATFGLRPKAFVG
jgi:hypothetical protein